MSLRELINFPRGTGVSVRRGDPMLSLQDEINRMFGDFFTDRLPAQFSADSLQHVPSMDVVETDNEIRVSAELPGMKAEDVEVSASDGYLTIKGEKKQEKEEKTQGFYRRERSYGSFHRAVALPEIADADNCKAEMKDGVLTITVPKKVEAAKKPQKIEVKSAA